MDFENMKQQKLDKEKTAFNDCREDMSDVSFEIGNGSYTTKVFGMIVLFAFIFGGRIFARRMVGNPDMAFSAADKIFWICIIIVAVIVVVSLIREKNKPVISVSGKTLFYGGNCLSSSDISYVKCSKWLELIEVYSNGRKVLTFSWEQDNSELFIAWIKKCGVAFVDNRMKGFR